MYDPVTRQLLQAIPPLAGLDREGLPELLTRIYGELVSLRLTFRQGSRPRRPSREDVDLIRRLADALETFAVVAAEGDERRSAAFVAATAHSLLRLHIVILGGGDPAGTPLPPSDSSGLLDRDWIAAEVSACLLFLVAGQTADATEMARYLVVSDGQTVRASVVRGIAALASGDLVQAARTAEATHSREAGLPEDALYDDIRLGLTALAAEVQGLGEVGRAQDLFLRVERRSVLVAREGEFASVSGFYGPHHLARLLRLAAMELLSVRTSGVSPPSGAESVAWRRLLRGIGIARPFLWPSHIEAVGSGFLAMGVSAVLTFPTGSGKSLMAELKIAAVLSTGGRVVYLAPTHALVSQVARDLGSVFKGTRVVEAMFDDDVARAEEEVGVILVMTPERALASLGGAGESLSCSLLIVDECHLIHPGQPDRLRRSLDATFCLMLMVSASPEMDIVLMSAMIENGGEIAGWIADLTARKCVALSVDWKPTRQLRGCLVFPASEVRKVERLIERERSSTLRKGPSANLKRKAVASPAALFSLRQTWATVEREDYVLARLASEQLPLSVGSGWSLTANRFVVAGSLARRFSDAGYRVLVFADSPRNAEKTARDVGKDDVGAVRLSEDEERLQAYAREDTGLASAPTSIVADRAVVHHGLLLPVERQLSESLFKRSRGGVVLVGTPTLAQGVNLPADVVILAGDERWDQQKEKNVPLAPEEVLNAVARAGRAGFSAVGVVLVVPGSVVSFDPGKEELGERWFELQESVFSKMDQCVRVDDPVELMIDVVQSGSVLSQDARYFLNRLPVDSNDATLFLQRTLGAFRARASGDSGREARVATVVQRRASDVAPVADWVMKLATGSGISIEFGNAIDEELRLNRARWAASTVWEIVDAFFAWAGTDPGLVAALARVTTPDPAEEEYQKVPLERLHKASLMWTEPRTLREIEGYLTEKATVATCWEARKCVLREIPDVAYALAVVAQAYRLSEPGNAVVPLALATASECLRAGLPTAAALAVWYEQKGRCSRIACAAEAAELDLDLDLDTATFAEVRREVRRARAQ